MPKKKHPSPHVMISVRDLKDIIRDELYGLGGYDIFPSETVKAVTKAIAKRALLSPKPSDD
jgi:hypothetical protein